MDKIIWDIQYGDRVKVVNPSLQSCGLVGTVTLINNNMPTAFVRFEDWHGQGTKELCFNISNLAKISSKNEKGGSVMAIKGNYDVAMVKFINGTNTTKEYAFALFSETAYLDDLVLCDTSNGYHVAKVVSIIPQNRYTGVAVTKEIICRVDFTAFEKRKELRKQKEVLKKQMDKLIADNQELILYQALAEKNPEMAEMLAVYKSLGDV